MLMLKQARMIDPSTKIDEIRDILISGRTIVTSGEDLSLDAPLIARAKGERLQIIDCTGLIAAPGLVDTRVHLREPGFTYKEDIQSGARAAARGGITTIIATADTNPPLDNEKEVLNVIHEGKRTNINIFTYSNLTKAMAGKELVDMKSLKDAGAIGYINEVECIEEEIIKEAMRKARILKLPLALLEEYTMVERDCKFAKDTGATVIIQNISTKESVESIKKAKKLGARVLAQVSPQYFSLTQEAVVEYNTLAKVEPPLRTNIDKEAIIEGLKDNTIEIITSDHSPHSLEEKNLDFVNAQSGMIGLETLLSLGIMNLVDNGHLTMMRLLGKMSYDPAKIYALEAGTLKDDAPADIVIFDPDEEWLYDESYSKSVNSPWFGKKLKGKVKMTIHGGSIIYKD